MVDLMKLKLNNKPPRKVNDGNKVYVSSKLVEALSHIKKHTEDLSVKRTIFKENVKLKPKARIIDETN